MTLFLKSLIDSSAVSAKCHLMWNIRDALGVSQQRCHDKQIKFSEMYPDVETRYSSYQTIRTSFWVDGHSLLRHMVCSWLHYWGTRDPFLASRICMKKRRRIHSLIFLISICLLFISCISAFARGENSEIPSRLVTDDVDVLICPEFVFCIISQFSVVRWGKWVKY